MRLHEFYPQYQGGLVPFPIDPVLGQIFSQYLRDYFRPLFTLDAGHKLQLPVDFRFEIERTAVAERLRRLFYRDD
jgi:hypothetical protein